MSSSIDFQAPAQPALGRLASLLQTLRVRAAAAGAGCTLRIDARQHVRRALALAQCAQAAGFAATVVLEPVGQQGETSSAYGRIVDGRIEHAALLLADVRAMALAGHRVLLRADWGRLGAHLGADAAAVRAAEVEAFSVGGSTVEAIDAEDSDDAAPVRRLDLAGLAAAGGPAGIVFGAGEATELRLNTADWLRDHGAPAAEAAALAPAPAPAIDDDPDIPVETPLAFVPADGAAPAVGLCGGGLAQRAFLSQRARFPRAMTLVAAEHAGLVALAEHGANLRPQLAAAAAACPPESLSWPERERFLAQFERRVLSTARLDLLILDTESDLAPQRWRHRANGWLAAFPAASPAVDESFDAVAPATADEIAAAVAALVGTLRERHPTLPVLLLHREDARIDPAALAAALDTALGRPAARARIHLRIVAADADDASAFARVLQDAWRAGLGRPFATTAVA